MAIPQEPVDPAASGPPPGEAAGIRESLRALARAAVLHVQLRLSLFGMEASEAAGHLGRVAAAALIALVGGAVAYFTGWAVLVLWAARHWAGGDLVPPLAVMAGVHGVAAVAAGWWLAARGRNRALFAATRAEFAEDQKWLHHPNP